MQKLCRCYQELRGSYAEVRRNKKRKNGREGGTPDMKAGVPPLKKLLGTCGAEYHPQWGGKRKITKNRSEGGTFGG